MNIFVIIIVLVPGLLFSMNEGKKINDPKVRYQQEELAMVQEKYKKLREKRRRALNEEKLINPDRIIKRENTLPNIKFPRKENKSEKIKQKLSGWDLIIDKQRDETKKCPNKYPTGAIDGRIIYSEKKSASMPNINS